MVVLKDCSHFLQEEKPAETKKYLLRFLDHIDASSPVITSEQSDEFEVKHLRDEPAPIQIDDEDAYKMDDCPRDFKNVYEKREDGPFFLKPFRGHRGLGLLVRYQNYMYFRKHKSMLKKL